MENSTLNDYELQPKAPRKRGVLVATGALILLLIGLLILQLFLSDTSPIPERVTLEAGRSLTIELFLKDPQKYMGSAIFKTDTYELDTHIPGEYPLVITVDGRDYETVLEILDRTAPTGEPVRLTTTPGVLPEPAELVTKIKDASAVTVEYVSEPDVSQLGTVSAEVKLTDAYGNSNILPVTISVSNDQTPPVIEGAVDLEYFLNETIDFESGITVTDNETASPTLTVDCSQVDFSTAGDYSVTYTARDEAGNESSVTVRLTLKEEDPDVIAEAIVIEMAQDVLDGITTDVMTPMEVAFAIFRWTSSRISYLGSSNSKTWQEAAYDAFTLRRGDDFSYFAAGKALMIAAGIENMDVVSTSASQPQRHWSLINLGDGWYHVDCSPRRNSGFFFMSTDEELEKYSQRNGNSHEFDSDAYPERATKSVQSLVNYYTGKVFG